MNTNDSAHQQPLDFPEGLPIYDRDEEQLGVVSEFGVQEQYLVMREGHLFHRTVSIPISAIERADAKGVYLNRTRQEIHDLTLGGWSSLGDVDLNTGTPAGGETNSPAQPLGQEKDDKEEGRS
jgi:hypothetical protein